MLTTSDSTQVRLREIIGPAFFDLHRQVRAGRVDEVVAKGGRGSLKSSYMSVELLLTPRPACSAGKNLNEPAAPTAGAAFCMP